MGGKDKGWVAVQFGLSRLIIQKMKQFPHLHTVSITSYSKQLQEDVLMAFLFCLQMFLHAHVKKN